MKPSNFTHRIKGGREHTAQQFPFSFSKLRCGPFGFNPRKFPQHLTNKWNWIRSMKFETVQLHFLSDVFGLVSSRNFATMATWRNKFPSLLANTIIILSPKQFHSPFNITDINPFLISAVSKWCIVNCTKFYDFESHCSSKSLRSPVRLCWTAVVSPRVTSCVKLCAKW